MRHWREDCLTRLKAAGTPTAALHSVSAIVKDLGFDYSSYVLKTPLPVGDPRVTWSSTYPSQWLDHYFGHDYLAVDPVVQAATRQSSPVVWASSGALESIPFWEEADAHGIRHGWALASYGKRMTQGMLSLARSHDIVTQDELEDIEPQLFWLTHVAHGVIAALVTPEGAEPNSRELTSREAEVLRWCANGKTADEIARILGVATRTVTFHVSSSLAKLNVINKTQAVATAFFLGLL